MGLSPSLETASCEASQELPIVLWEPHFSTVFTRAYTGLHPETDHSSPDRLILSLNSVTKKK
jgi:hypothetical protein